MNFNNDTLTKALDFWDSRQPVEAGRILFEAIKPSERPKWAVAVLRLAQERSTLVSQSIQHLLRISDDSGNWPLAKQVFSTLRAEVLKLERLQTLTVPLLNTQAGFGFLQGKALEKVLSPCCRGRGIESV